MTPTWTKSLPDEDATDAAARSLAPLLAPGDLVVLSGTLGAGKTFFTGCLLRALGLDEDVPVTSPTYALVGEYELPDGAVRDVSHADLYRLSSVEEAEELGLLERREHGALLVVEWGEPYIEALGGRAIEVSFTVEPRSVELTARSERAEQVVRALRSLDEERAG